jgi:hypothetical protein
MAQPLANGVRLVIPAGTGVAFDADAFDTSIRSQGVPFTHWRAMRCPVGLVDRYDDRRPHDDHSGCSNGFIYTNAGTVTALFVNSGSKADQQDIGVLDGSTVQVTLPRFYDDTDEEVQVVNYDRFYVPDTILVPTWQLVETSPLGRDKLSFPAIGVVDLMDSTGKRYASTDFSIQNGQIVWVNGAGPGYDLEQGKGIIYSIRYTYRPYFYVQRMIHQVRIAQVETLLERSVMRMPQEVVLQREYIAEKEDNDDRAPPGSGRQVKGPRDGIFPPR